MRAVRRQVIPDRRPRHREVRRPPRARHPETCVPDGPEHPCAQMRLQFANRSCCGPGGARRWEPARLACPLPASALFWAPGSHACTNAAWRCATSPFLPRGAAPPAWERLQRRSAARNIGLGLRCRTACVTVGIRARCGHPRTRADAADPHVARGHISRLFYDRDQLLAFLYA